MDNLGASGELAGMYALALLCFADAMGGWSIGNGERDLRGGTGPTHGSGRMCMWKKFETDNRRTIE
jgi:hypothetical protein